MTRAICEPLIGLMPLDDCESWNGPLKLIPGSHRGGHIKPLYDTETTSYALHTVPEETVELLLAGDEPQLCDGRTTRTRVLMPSGLRGW